MFVVVVGVCVGGWVGGGGRGGSLSYISNIILNSTVSNS